MAREIASAYRQLAALQQENRGAEAANQKASAMLALFREEVAVARPPAAPRVHMAPRPEPDAAPAAVSEPTSPPPGDLIPLRGQSELRLQYAQVYGKLEGARAVAEEVRQNLGRQGTGLRAEITAALVSAGMHLEVAQRAIEEGDLNMAQQSLDQAGFDTAKVLKAFGQ